MMMLWKLPLCWAECLMRIQKTRKRISPWLPRISPCIIPLRAKKKMTWMMLVRSPLPFFFMSVTVIKIMPWFSLHPRCWSFCALQKKGTGRSFFPNARRNERVWGDLATTTGCMHLKNSEEGFFFSVQFVNFFPSISTLTLSAEQEGFFAPSVCCDPLLWGGPQEELWSEIKEHTKYTVYCLFLEIEAI